MMFSEMEHDWFEHHQCARLLHVHGHLVAQAGLLKHTVMWWHLPMHAGGWTICGLVSIPQVLWGEAAEPTLLGRAESHALRAFSSSSPFRRWWGWRRQNRRCKRWGQKEDNGESSTRKTWARDKELKGKAAASPSFTGGAGSGSSSNFHCWYFLFFCVVYITGDAKSFRDGVK